MKNIFLFIFVLLTACKKEDAWLDKRYSNRDVVPQTLDDFQGLLDNTDVMNSNYPVLGLMGTDNFYVPDQQIATLQPVERNTYQWVQNLFEGDNSGDWNDSYKIVAYANVVLEGLEKMDKTVSSNQAAFDQIRGSALFFRALAFYNLVQTFAKPYSASNNLDLGIPLRSTADINVRSARASLGDSYIRVINDLLTAASLLPVSPLKNTRPGKAAAYGLLAKTYLHMGQYADAQQSAEQALAINSTLLDFNSVPPGFFTFIPYSLENPEFIFRATSASYAVFNPLSKALIDTSFYASYETNDLRKDLFFIDFGGPIYFRGSYTVGLFFGGIATNELYLILSEALARQNQVVPAMEALNTLLRNRYAIDSYTAKTASTQLEALSIILAERRKELPFTGQSRWEDLRRLNQDPAFAVTLKRVIDGQIITLSPNDIRYVLPIPEPEIRISGLEQNER